MAGGDARAQSHVDRRPGPFAAVDLAGGPFLVGMAYKVAGGAVGYRFGHGADLALRVERARAQDWEVFEEPGQTLLGTEAGFAFGSERSPWRLALAAGAVWEDRSELATFADGGYEFRGGRRLSQADAALSLTRYVGIGDAAAPVRLLLGGGVFGEVRRLASETTTFQAGSPQESVVHDAAVTEWPFGVVLTAPVAVRLGRAADLVLEPVLRLDALTLGLGGGSDAYVSLRLDL